MGTINDRNYVDRIIAGNGRIDPENAPDNPWCVKIVEYTSAWGNTAYGLIFQGEPLEKYEASDYVRNPKTLWERKPFGFEHENT